jgi:hypothetical protein
MDVCCERAASWDALEECSARCDCVDGMLRVASHEWHYGLRELTNQPVAVAKAVSAY